MLKNSSFRVRSGLALSVSLASLGIATCASAQSGEPKPEPAAASEETGDPTGSQVRVSSDEIVVTGTLIRGIAPAGASVINLSQEAIAMTGASNSVEVLKNIPQIGQFIGPDVGLSNPTNITVQRMNLRNIPNVQISSTNPTLILLDGHRIVNAGVRQQAVDADMVPPGVIERIDVMPDGGSATYGTDAIGGVINFITRRRFDGLEVDLKRGFGIDYKTLDAYATAGKDWGSGGAYVSVNYSKNDDIRGRDRGFAQRFAPAPSGRTLPDNNCAPGTVRIGAVNYAIPGLQPNTENNCDTSDTFTLWPKKERVSVFGSINQSLSDDITFDVRGFWSKNENTFFETQRSSVAITSANPFYRRTADNPAPQTPLAQSVLFSWEPVVGTELPVKNLTKGWGVTPTLTANVGTWQIRAMANIGGSTTRVDQNSINATLLNNALRSTNAATAFNPYDVASNSAAVIGPILDFKFFGESFQKMRNFRVIADGTLFTLPGGDVRVAAGVELLRESISYRSSTVVPSTIPTVPFVRGSRVNKSVFGELSIPLFGEDNATSLFRALELSVSARYDHYSDFGSTFNPKIGFTYKPTDDLKIRGSWSTAFNAPALVDSVAVSGNTVSTTVTASSLVNPLPGQFTSTMSGWRYIIAGGVAPSIKPQTGKTMEIGTDFTPSFLPGARLSLTLYHITLKDQIASPPFNNLLNFYRYYTPFYIMFPSEAQVRQFLAQDVPQAEIDRALTGIFTPGSVPIYAVAANVRRNLGKAKLTGLDFNFNYTHQTGFGSIDAAVNGVYLIKQQQQPVAGSPWINDTVSDINRLKLQATLGANVDTFRAQLTWNHRHGYKVTPTAANNNTTHAGSFNVFNLYFRYNIENGTFLKDTTLSLAINDVLNQRPPFFRGSSQNMVDGWVNGFSVGRVVQLGIKKNF